MVEKGRAICLEMPLDVHALMQHPHNSDASIFGNVRHDVRLILHTPQIRREFTRATAVHRVFGEGLE
jgi:hypothetical protein